jgi:hypothetical protein
MGGGKLVGIPGVGARVSAQAIRDHLANEPGGTNHPPFRGLSFLAGHRMRHGASSRRDCRDCRGGACGGHEGAYGRRAICQCAADAGVFAGGDDLEGRGRLPVVRRHQERLPDGRGGGVLRFRSRAPISSIAASAPDRRSPRGGCCRRSSRPIWRAGIGWTSRRAPMARPRGCRRGWRRFPACDWPGRPRPMRCS